MERGADFHVLSLQQDAQHPETFSPRYLSLTHKSYEEMVRALRLPFRAIEGTSVVGPFFWSSMDQDDEDPHLRTGFVLVFVLQD
jgi:hypothetical protein